MIPFIPFTAAIIASQNNLRNQKQKKQELKERSITGQLLLLSETEKVEVNNMNFITRSFTFKADHLLHPFFSGEKFEDKVKEVSGGKKIIGCQLCPYSIEEDHIDEFLVILTLEK